MVGCGSGMTRTPLLRGAVHPPAAPVRLNTRYARVKHVVLAPPLTGNRHRPDVVLMDIRMPDMDGLTAARQILTGVGEAPRSIMLTTFDLDQYVYAALTAGASGFLLKDVTPEQLVAAVRLVRSGDALLAPAITRRLVQRFAQRDTDPPAIHRDLSTLTPRELEVLGLLAQGLSNAELAGRLHLSEATVKTHVARILAKLGLRDRVQAVVVAYRTGLVTP
ncbi:DNA-binding response regulator [Micromonospora arborensis]|uniref:DNA-binding response regulator n=1 Tax=Micromonospora arborensis TaxID=2116518 RepID=A0A318NIF2_9ACTN|nr:DNA-binding response regulator [Micromonospora arborensis]